ncbi:hypothetical protein EIP91_007294 [Steccherinum ochraceum]|uniref:DUF6534 domain-containing protein n=1 Tax=Steccherinum ochraceum TaxID=92696 RepID=A0A4R0R4F9_9APHY|nr:hypothetical protein EIP91_007294 [Steccherinum ochraceum]
MDPLPPPVPDLASFVRGFVGGYYIVAYLTLTLYGMFLAQVYHYAFNVGEDERILKYTVVVVTFLETCHTAFILHATYDYQVLSFGKPGNFVKIPWSAGVSIATGMVITLIVQSFYIRRIYVPAVDISIAGLLIFYLLRSRTGFKSTDHLVHTLSAYAVNTGFITMCSSTLSLIMFFVMQDNIVFAGLIVMTGKLYANSFLGNLNARDRLRNHKVEIKGSSAIDSSYTISNEGSQRPPPGIQVYQQSLRVVTSDSSANMSSEHLSKAVRAGHK